MCSIERNKCFTTLPGSSRGPQLFQNEIAFWLIIIRKWDGGLVVALICSWLLYSVVISISTEEEHEGTGILDSLVGTLVSSSWLG